VHQFEKKLLVLIAIGIDETDGQLKNKIAVVSCGKRLQLAAAF